ncbi:hypothetical protein UM91_22000 [Pseudomonas oryzihabitans]|nr:hypothetical protein UM91_22000 [Pseudomonas oryzihabitans]
MASTWSWICSGLDVDGQAGALGELQGDAGAAGQVLVIDLQHRGAGRPDLPGHAAGQHLVVDLQRARCRWPARGPERACRAMPAPLARPW